MDNFTSMKRSLSRCAFGHFPWEVRSKCAMSRMRIRVEVQKVVNEIIHHLLSFLSYSAFDLCCPGLLVFQEKGALLSHNNRLLMLLKWL